MIFVKENMMKTCGGDISVSGMSTDSHCYRKVQGSNSLTEASTRSSEKGNDDNYFSDILNSVASMFNLPYEIGSSDSSSFDDDTSNKTRNTSDSENMSLGSWISNREERYANSIESESNRENDVNLLCHSDLRSSLVNKRDRDIDSITTQGNKENEVNLPLLCNSEFYSNSFDSSNIEETPRSVESGKIDKSMIPSYYEYESNVAQLYRAIDTQNWEAAYKYITSNPKLASKWIYQRDKSSGLTLWAFLPLHAACFSGTPASLVKIILRAYPKSAESPAQGGKLPLHIACETGAPDDVIHCIANAFPLAIHHPDQNGNTPLKLCEIYMKGRKKKKSIKMLKKISRGKGSQFMVITSGECVEK